MILKNNFDKTILKPDQKSQILDVFDKSSGHKTISLEKSSSLQYVFVMEDSDVDLDFELIGESAKLDLFGIFVWDVKSTMIASLLANKAFANVRVLSLVKEDSDVHVDWSIFIGKNIQKVEWHLLEEQFLLWNPKNLFVRPILDVHSDDVKASHWAKIHTLEAEKLFYMMSKWLSLEEAQWLVIKSEIESIFAQLTDIESEIKQEILNQILLSAFSL